MATIKPARADARDAFGKLDAGNPYVRFDEGRRADKTVSPLLSSTRLSLVSDLKIELILRAYPTTFSSDAFFYFVARYWDKH